MGHPPSRSHGLQLLHPCQHLELSVLIIAILHPHGVKSDYTQQPRVLNRHKSLHIQDRPRVLSSPPEDARADTASNGPIPGSWDPRMPWHLGVWVGDWILLAVPRSSPWGCHGNRCSHCSLLPSSRVNKQSHYSAESILENHQPRGFIVAQINEERLRGYFY